MIGKLKEEEEDRGVIGKMMMTWRRDDDDTLTWLNKVTWHVKWYN